MQSLLFCPVNNSAVGLDYLQGIISNVNTYVIPSVSFACLLLNVSILLILKYSLKKRFYKYILCLNITENLISLTGVFYAKSYTHAYKDVYFKSSEDLMITFYFSIASRAFQLAHVFGIIFLNQNRLNALLGNQNLFINIKAKFLIAAFISFSLLLYAPTFLATPVEYKTNGELFYYLNLKPYSKTLMIVYTIILIFIEFIITNSYLIYLTVKLRRKFLSSLKKFKGTTFKRKDINYTRLTLNFTIICLTNRFQDAVVTLFFRMTIIYDVSFCTVLGTWTNMIKAFSNLFVFTSLVSTSVIMFCIDRHLRRRIRRWFII